jgi:putative endonuclease
MDFYIYIIYSSSFDKFYIGHSENPWRRIEEHNADIHHKFTSSYMPWELRAVFKLNGSRGEAMKIEKFIKKQNSRKLILKMIESEFMPAGILARLVRVPHVRD